MRENLGETENEAAYENLRAEDALLMVRNNEVAIVEEEEESSIVQCYVAVVVVLLVHYPYWIVGVRVRVLILRARIHFM